MFKNVVEYLYILIYGDRIPDIIIYLLGKNLEKYLHLKDLHNLKNTDKELYNNDYVSKEIRYQKCILNNYLKYWYIHSKILKYFKNSFFPEHLIRLLPVLQWKKKYIGCTDYIDCITETNLEYPIMIGIDHFKRPFLTIKYLYNCEYTKTKNCKGRITVFQRYSDCTQTWVKCNNKGPFFLITGSSKLNCSDKKRFVNNIIRFITDKKILIDKYDNQYDHLETIEQTCKLY